VNAGDGLGVGRLVIFAAIFLSDGVEAVELYGFKWIVAGRLPNAVTEGDVVASICCEECDYKDDGCFFRDAEDGIHASRERLIRN